MREETFVRIRFMLLKASVAMAFAVAPFHMVFHHNDTGFGLVSAFAKDGQLRRWLRLWSPRRR